MLFQRRLGERIPKTLLLETPTRKRNLVKVARSFSRLGGGGSDYSVKVPRTPLQAWESGAKLVQNTTVENNYLEHIRAVHDPSQHLKTIEDELKGTIGKALGKQAHKVQLYAQLMDQERQKYEDLLQHETPDVVQLQDHAQTHNQWRQDCLQARWELIVHRQAVGFTVGNHKFVMENFPVGEELPVDQEVDSDGTRVANTNKNNSKQTKSIDQLDWWSRIGRWN